MVFQAIIPILKLFLEMAKVEFIYLPFSFARNARADDSKCIIFIGMSHH